MSNADPGRTRPVFQWLAQLFALMGKESKQIIRDPSSYLVAAILPMIFLLLFGYGITLDAGVMDIVILDESNSQSGLQLQENFAHSPELPGPSDPVAFRSRAYDARQRDFGLHRHSLQL